MFVEIALRWVTPTTGQEREQQWDIGTASAVPTLTELENPSLEMGVYAGLDQGGYGTGGTKAALERLGTLLRNYEGLDPQLGNLLAYRNMALLL